VTVRTDVLVVGAGAVGVAVAHYLALEGVGVVAVDARDHVGGECSYGNAGLIVPSHVIPHTGPGLLRRVPRWLLPGSPIRIRPRLSPSLVRFGRELRRACTAERQRVGSRALRELTHASGELFEGFDRDGGLEFGYERAGSMSVAISAEGLDDLLEHVRLLEREGIRGEPLDADETREREPLLRGPLAGSVHWPEDAHCDPGRFVAELARVAAETGAEFHLGTRVTGLARRADGTVAQVSTSSRDYEAGTVVVAAGAWSPVVARMAAVALPIEAGKGYHLQFRAGAPELRVPLTVPEAAVAASPIGGGLRITGRVDFDGLDNRPRGRRVSGLRAFAEQHFAGLESAGEPEPWCGLRPMSPDTLPVLGRSSSVPNLIFATGHGMLGVTLAPISGLSVAELVAGRAPSVDLGAVVPARFGA
jgi:D-amino-acid dehydrogenase